MMKVNISFLFFFIELIISLFINLGDTEEFKVNKTRESRKMTKEIKKQQQQLQNTSIDPKSNVVIQQTTTTTTVEEIITTKEENNNGELEITCIIKIELFFRFYFFFSSKFLVKPLQIIGNKSSANSFTSTNADLQVISFLYT